MSPSEADIARLEGLRAGDLSALAELYHQYGAIVYRFALAMARDPDIAADAVQDTFVWLASEGALRFDPSRSSLAAFLCGVVRNHIFRRREHDSRFVSTTTQDSDSGPEYGDTETSVTLIETEGSEAQAEHALTELLRRERRETLLQALRSLHLEHREVLILVEFEELSYEDAAGIIGCPIGTVRSRLHRARAALKARLLSLDPGLQEPGGGEPGI